jgi:hypothetical protein
MPDEVLNLSSIKPPSSVNGRHIASVFPANTHICHFYRTEEDLLELMIPYFLEGLGMGEFCLWGVAAPLTVKSATEALNGPLMGGLNIFASKGQIEIFDVSQLYGTGPFDAKSVCSAFLTKVAETQGKGWTGFRCDGMASGVSPRNWSNYQIYEQHVSDLLPGRTTALCSYNASKLSADEIAEVTRTHQASIIKRGRWVTQRPSAA